jgi:hypothetical protein
MNHLIGWSYWACRTYLWTTVQYPHEWTITTPACGSNYRFRGMTMDDSVVILGPSGMYWESGAGPWLDEVYAHLHYRETAWTYDDCDRYR